MRCCLTWCARVVVLATLALAAPTCGGEDVGPQGHVVGGPCTAGSDCSPGSTCMIATDYPGGMCARACSSDAQCPAGSVCISKDGSTCQPSCSTSADCRGGYACKSKSRSGGGNALICVHD